VPSKELVQYFGFTFEDDTDFYKANVNSSWQPEVHFEERSEPDLDEAITAIQRIPNIPLTIVDVYDSSGLYYMLLSQPPSMVKSARDCRTASCVRWLKRHA
jgi:hypothetical protein